MTEQQRTKKFSPQVRQRAVRMVLEHRGEHASEWAAIGSIAAKMGCTAETLRSWVRQAQRDQGQRPGTTSDERERIRALERENRELRQANEILRKPSADTVGEFAGRPGTAYFWGKSGWCHNPEPSIASNRFPSQSTIARMAQTALHPVRRPAQGHAGGRGLGGGTPRDLPHARALHRRRRRNRAP